MPDNEKIAVDPALESSYSESEHDEGTTPAGGLLDTPRGAVHIARPSDHLNRRLTEICGNLNPQSRTPVRQRRQPVCP